MGEGRFVWSVGESFGNVIVDTHSHTVTVKGEPVSLSSYGYSEGRQAKEVYIDGEAVSFETLCGKVIFEKQQIKTTLKVVFHKSNEK